MSLYVLAPRALLDLSDIAAFAVDRWSDRKAASYLDAMRSRFEWLADNPLLGRSRDELYAGLRCWRQEAHMIFYRIAGDGIEIIGVPHASADFGAYFGEGG